MVIRLAGCVLLDEKNRIGLLHRNKKGIVHWELPGGKIEPDEKPEEAAIREIKEELNVDVTIERKVGGDKFTRSDKQDFDYEWFLAYVVSGQPEVNEPDTFDDFKYFELNVLGLLKLSDNMQNLFKQLSSGQVKL